MSHTYISSYYHIVFGTKNRDNLITPEIKENLWYYMGGIARENNMKALIIGGTENHVHVLLSLPATLTLAKAVQLLKGGASYWIHQTYPQYQDFTWQQGYGAFSIGMSQLNKTIAYIQNQEKHHALKSFESEFLTFLKTHQIQYDPKYIWG